jgi:hypothetical protein
MDSTAHTGQPSGGDWQEEVYQIVLFYYLIFISCVNWVYKKKIDKQLVFVPRNILIYSRNMEFSVVQEKNGDGSIFFGFYGDDSYPSCNI